MNSLGKLFFFLSSNSPAFVIWGIFQYECNKSVFIILLIISCLSYLGMFLLFFLSKKRQPKELFDVKIENNVNSKMMEYMVSYILPFISLDSINSIETTVALCVYYFVLFGVYIKSDIFYINPILNIVGFNIFKITYKEDKIEKNAFVITKNNSYEIHSNRKFSILEKNIFIYERK